MMADFLNGLIREAQGAAPEVRPLLPPRFAAWPGIPLAIPGSEAQERDALQPIPGADWFAPPLVTPNHPAMGVPLPTFRQMAGLPPALAASIQPAREPAAQSLPETDRIEPDENRQVVHRPQGSHPTAPSPVPGPPASSIQSPPESAAVLPAVASPTHPRASSSQAAPHLTRNEPEPAPPPAPVQYPESPSRSAALEHHTSADERSPGSPSRLGVEIGPVAVEPIVASPGMDLGLEKPVSVQPGPVEAPRGPDFQPPAVVANPTESIEARIPPDAGDVKPVENRVKPGENRVELFETRFARVEDHPVTILASPGLREASSNPAERRTRLIGDQPEPIQPRPVSVVQPKQAFNSAKTVYDPPGPVVWPHDPIETRVEPAVGMPDTSNLHPVSAEPQPQPGESSTVALYVPRIDASLPPSTRPSLPILPVIQPAAPVPAQLVQRQFLPGSLPASPVASQPAHGSGDKPPAPVGAEAAHRPAVLIPLSQRVEPAENMLPPAPGWSEPVITPAPQLPQRDSTPAAGIEGSPKPHLPLGRYYPVPPEPLPTVRVSIGRVVVRASLEAEPASSRPVELPRPAISLEEYLRGRRGGER